MLIIFLILHCFSVSVLTQELNKNSINLDELALPLYSSVVWPNATIPFYIDSDHFDHEQSLQIMTTLSFFAYKTCLKFSPVLVKPKGNLHVLLFENPEGINTCSFNHHGHPRDEPHRVQLGYKCLQSPDIDMMVMRALGLPFEHNRITRDKYVDIQLNNIEPGAVELFTKDTQLPLELKHLPYDINSVLHFGVHDYSKNGHRTIIIKNSNVEQKRTTLTEIDLKKIEIVYGPECRRRDRQEKIDLCQNYPGVARRKRDTQDTQQNLRVNRDITPPPLLTNTSSIAPEILSELNLNDDVQVIVEQLHKLAGLALHNARIKYCNTSQPEILEHNTDTKSNKSNILGIVENIADYIKSMVDNALSNLKEFCEESKSLDTYMRAGCLYENDPRCQQRYKSTKSGRVWYSTQKRPYITMSTKHRGGPSRHHEYVKLQRSGNETDEKGEKLINETVEEAVTESIHVEKDTENASDKKDAQTMNKPSVAESPSRRFGKIGSRFRIKKREDSSGENKEESKQSAEVEKETEKKYTRNDPQINEEVSETTLKVKDFIEADITSHNKRKKKRQRKLIRKPSVPKRSSKKRQPKKVPLSKINEEFYSQRRWDGGIVRYMISDENNYDLDDMRLRLKEVKDILLKKTCVEIDEITVDQTEMFEDYLVLDTSPDYVSGRVGGKQNFGCIELFEGGQHRQHAAMMVMAMLGFYFEVSRHDREKYIRVHNRHIRPDKLHHFDKIRSDATLPLPYDYESALHPAWQFWRKIGKTGISTVATFKHHDPDGTIMKSLGQHDKLLSDIDIVKINSVYGTKCFENQRRTKLRRIIKN